MTDDAATATQPPAEPPLGIRQPLLPPTPLGQSMLQPKFFTPLGAQSLRVLDPSIFLPYSDLAVPNEDAPFQSPFFDAPDTSTPLQAADSAVQTKSQPRPPNPTPSEINLPTTAPFERIAEPSMVEASTNETLIAQTFAVESPIAEDLAIAEPLIARSPIADLATPIAEAPTNETLIAQTFAVESPIAEDHEIAEPLIARSPIAETDAAIASPLIVEESTTEALPSAPREAAIAQAPQSEPLNRFESPSPSISRLSTETHTDTPAEHSIEPPMSTVSALDSAAPTETANEYPEAPLLERSPFFPNNVITPISTQPTDSAAVQRTTNLEESASTIAPISGETTTISSAADLTTSDTDLTKPIQPESISTDNILSLAPVSDPTIAASPPIDNSGAIAASTDSAIAKPSLDAPAAIALGATKSFARLTVDESIDSVVDVAESVVPAADRVPLENREVEEPSPPAPLPQERGAEVVSLLPTESNFRYEDGSNTVSQEKVAVPKLPDLSPAPSSSEPSSTIARLGEPEASVDVSFPSEPIGETIQRSPLEPTISEPATPDREDDTVAAIASHPVDNPISAAEIIQPKTSDSINQGVENLAEISLEQLSSEPNRLVEEPRNLQNLDTEVFSQPISLDSSVQSVQSTTNTQIDPVTQLNIQPQAEVQPIASDRPEATQTSSIQPISDIAQPIQRKVADAESIISEVVATAENESSIGTDRTSLLPQNLQDLDVESLAQPIALDTLVQRVQPETNTRLDPVSQSNTEPIIQPQVEAPSIASDRPEATQTPSIQPISDIAQPVQRKVVEVDNSLSEAGAEAEDESSLDADQTGPLPELPSVLQRLSILEPIATMKSMSTAPDTAPVSRATVQLTSATRSSVIPEIQPQPFESLFEVPFEAPSVRRKSDVGANDYVTQSAIASSPDSLTPNSLTPSSPTQELPVTAEWGNIAELFNPSAAFHSPLEPENTFPDDNYPDLLSSTHSTSSEMIQTSPTPPVEAAAPVETETNGDRETPAQSANSGSPEHLERLAQEVYQLIRQRLALERERGGKSGSGRLL